MKSLNIVIIGQWIYPMLSPRAHRTWQLATHFAKLGHNVTVYALLGNTDYSEYEQKYNMKIRNLGKSYLGCVDSDGGNSNFVKRVVGKLFRDSLHFPQIELKGLTKKVIENINEDVDLLITIAFPHPIHWGAAEAMPKKNIKFWIADCGDPYMLNPFHRAPKYFEKEEHNWCRKCDAITVPIEGAKRAYYSEYLNKIHVIPQGFDFSETKLAPYVTNAVPTFAFSGQVYPGTRDPKSFLKYLLSLDADFKFIVYSKLKRHFEPYASLLGDKIEFREYVPRETLIYELSKMDFLININNVGMVQQPSKLIDYAQTTRQIITISSEFDQVEKLRFNKFLKYDFSDATIVDNIDEYNIETICGKMLELSKM